MKGKPYTSPPHAAPPKSGCSPRVAPMNVMKLAALASRGAALTSVLHQLLGGNSGRGRGMVPPWVAADADPQRRISAAARISRRNILDCGGRGPRAGVRSLTE